MKKNIIIIILTVLILGMGGYLVYDKLIYQDVKDKEIINESIGNESVEKVKIEQKDAEYFNEYLKAFTSCDGTFVSRNTTDFNNIDISSFVTSYYQKEALQKEEYKNNLENPQTYNVPTEKVNTLVKKYFDIENYEIVNTHYIKVRKPNEFEYQFEWESVGCGYIEYKNPVVTYDDINVTVKYELYDMMKDAFTGNYSTFYLKYNNGDYNIIKIEE